MKNSLTFLGAAQNVTGARFLLQAGPDRFLVDCGMVQERALQARNWEPLAVPPSSLNAVFLTHAHLDHCGLLPRLAAGGFKGQVHCTPATAELAMIVLEDAARLQAEDAEHKRWRHEKEGRVPARPVQPLYGLAEVAALRSRFQTAEYNDLIPLSDHAEAVLREAGHVLGSSMVEIRCGFGGERRSVIFTGDIGRSHRPILRGAESPAVIDTIVMESTYGDREHPRQEGIEDRLAAVVNDALERGGNVVVPIFAIERAQEMLYYLDRLRRSGRIPAIPVFLDSPMAVKVTQVFRRHSELYDAEMAALFRRGESPFDMPGLKLVRTRDSSKALNQIRGTAVIMAGAGMCTGGRIKYHLAHNLGRPASTILFVGYQAAGTLGRQLLDGAPEVRLFGEMRAVRAKVERIGGFSGHADREELLAWLGHLSEPPRQILVVHGEADAAQAFAAFLREKTGWNVAVPAYGETVELA